MNNTFHTTLVTATQNEMLLSFVVQSHRVPLAGSRHVHWYQFDQENFAIAHRAHEAHHEIYLAIRDRQAVSAESLMREHMSAIKFWVLPGLRWNSKTAGSSNDRS